MKRGTLVLGGYGTGTFTYGDVTQSTLTFILYDGEVGILEKAIEIVKSITATPNTDTSDAYQADFLKLPAKVLRKLEEGDDFGFSLDYDPYDNVAGASWITTYLHGDPIIIT